jgi:abhydrolase domain-containing protein 12
MDYRGFGDSSCPDRAFTGCTSEAGVMHDAFQTYDWLTQPHDQGGMGIPTKCILVHGHSLGTAIASRVAAKLTELGRAPAGVILESPMTVRCPASPLPLHSVSFLHVI